MFTVKKKKLDKNLM